MELNNSHKQKQDTYEPPRLLTKLELELLSQEMKDSLALMQKQTIHPLRKSKVMMNTKNELDT